MRYAARRLAPLARLREMGLGERACRQLPTVSYSYEMLNSCIRAMRSASFSEVSFSRNLSNICLGNFAAFHPLHVIRRVRTRELGERCGGWDLEILWRKPSNGHQRLA